MIAVAETCIETTQFAGRAAEAVALSALERRFVENWGRLSAAFGMGEVTGRVHAVAFLADDALSPADVAHALGINAAEAVEELTRLRDFGAVAEAGRGPATYLAERDPWAFFASVVRRRAEREFSPLLTAIRSLHEVANEAHRDGRLSKARMQRIVTFSQFVDQVARMLETFGGGASSKPMMSAARVVARFFR